MSFEVKREAIETALPDLAGTGSSQLAGVRAKGAPSEARWTKLRRAPARK